MARVAFRPGRVNRLLGTNFEPDEQAALLRRVGIDVETAEGAAAIPVAAGEKPLTIVGIEPALVAIVPTWRRDLHIEADIAEEIARVRGYDAVPTKTPGHADAALPARSPRGAGRVPPCAGRRRPQRGGDRGARPGGPGRAPALAGRRRERRARRGRRGRAPRSAPGTRCPSVMPSSGAGLVGSLLDVLAFNERHGHLEAAIFEIGKGYARGADGSPAEWWRLGFLLAGDAVAPTWSLAGRSWDVEDAKAIAALAARVIGAAEPSFRAQRRRRAPPSGPSGARGRRRAARMGWSGSCTPRRSRPGTCASERVIVGRARARGPGRRPAAARPGGAARTARERGA